MCLFFCLNGCFAGWVSAASVPHFLFLSALAGFAAASMRRKMKSMSVKPQRDEPAIAEERQRDADDGHKAHHHAHVDEDVEEEDAGDAVAVDAPEFGGLPLCQMDDPQDEVKKRRSTAAEPMKPSSSPTVQKMKSVSCSGTYLSLVCVPFMKPFPSRPPEPMAILLWLTL